MSESKTSELIPLMASTFAALSLLAFFRPWIELSLGEGSGAPARPTGAVLANDIGGPIPLLYLTPITLAIILAISCVAMFRRTRRFRIVFGLVSSVLSAGMSLWPFWPLTRVIGNMARLSSVTQASASLSGWWWLYSVSLAAIFVSAIIELVIAARTRT
jgi:hypothetical protein